MTRLKPVLLAGTLVPLLALTPLVPAAAQAPDQNERPGRPPHPDGARPERGGGERHPGRDAQNAPEPRANRGPGAGEAPPGAARRRAGEERPQGRPEGRPGGERAQNREDRGGPPGERRRGDVQPRDNAQRDEPDAPRRGAAAPDRAPEPQRAQSRDDRQERRDRRNDAAERPATPPAAPQRLGDDERRGGAGRARDVGADRDRRDDRLRDRNDNARRPDDPGASRRLGNDERRGGPDVRIEVGGPGLGGGFMAPTGARRLDDIRRDRREVRQGDRVFIREPGRTIIQQNGRAFVVHDENDRYRALGLDVRRERRGAEQYATIVRPGGETIITVTDADGRLLRRIRRGRDGREFVLIDNGIGGRVRDYAEDVVVLPPPPMRIPRDRYVVDYRAANAGMLYDTLIAPPLAPPPQRYTLDQIRYSPDVRGYVRSIDINTINFDSGSWDVPAAATGQLEALGDAIRRAVDRNPNSVFLVEGYTDATGNPDDNLSLSDRRAQSVAEILTKDFQVPPENLTTQGYGQQNLKEPTQGPSAANRRVVVRNITQLLAAGNEPPPGQ